MSADTIAIDDLRVGMFIHLDLGWMAHPFALSSFKIASPDQINTLRGLGLARVRWEPQRSEQLAPVAAQPGGDAPVAPDIDPASAHAAPEDAQRLAREAALAALARAEALCERQFAEAAREVRRVHDQVQPQPQQALASVTQLTDALLDKMLVDGHLNVRLLTEPTGDRASTHALNATTLVLLLGRQLNLPREHLSDLGVASLLHDVGQQQLPDRLRLRRDDFTAAEAAAYRQHVAHSVTLTRAMGVSPGALLAIAQHHEQLDGSGFPQGLAGERIGQLSRLLALTNAFDNLCNPAEVAKALTPHEALSRLFSLGRSKYDASLVSALIRLLGIYPPGSVVELSDNRLGLVLAVNDAHPLKPTVLAYDAKASSHKTFHLDLASHPDLGIRRSLRPDQLPASAAAYLRPRRRLTYFFDPDPPGDPDDAA